MKHIKTFESFDDDSNEENWEVMIDGEVVSKWEYKADAISDGILEYLNAMSGYLLFIDSHDQSELSYELEDMNESEFYDKLEELIKEANKFAEKEVIKEIKLYCLDGSEDEFEKND